MKFVLNYKLITFHEPCLALYLEGQHYDEIKKKLNKIILDSFLFNLI